MSSSVVSLRTAAGTGAPAAAPAASAALRTVYVGKISCSVSPQHPHGLCRRRLKVRSRSRFEKL